MNATVVEQVENDAGGDGSNMDEGKTPYNELFRPLFDTFELSDDL